MAELARPAQFEYVTAGDLYLSVDLAGTPNASLAVFVPDDRGLLAADWLPSLSVSALVAYATAPSTAEWPVFAIARCSRGARCRAPC